MNLDRNTTSVRGENSCLIHFFDTEDDFRDESETDAMILSFL